ncbi:uncharacterized protein LOC128852302 isoform X2 [Cuculus canorus]|uniref:uncharacterized protein LOC128852302 isoform X2 n=1 Tax=Cuculus canorus TaxID=55661 RepID=UPI0023AA6FD0|nr:uncharacterized protein LOC128852302 isoform X2 [Cuculus canorus]
MIWKITLPVDVSLCLVCCPVILVMPHAASNSIGNWKKSFGISLQSHGWWCGTDGARVTSRLFSGPCKQSRPMTCSIMPFEEEASSVTTKKNQGVPFLTIGSSSWLQRGVQHLSILQQDHFIICRAREANCRSMDIVISSVIFPQCLGNLCSTKQSYLLQHDWVLEKPEVVFMEAQYHTVWLSESSNLTSPSIKPPFDWAEIPWYFTVSEHHSVEKFQCCLKKGSRPSS